MGLSDRFRTKLADAVEKTKSVAADAAELTKSVAADGAEAAKVKAKEALETRGGTAGPRLLALLRMDDEQPVTIEALVVLLVDAVRGDDEVRELSDRDVYKAAKRRYRRLGTLSLPTGPVGWHVVGLYCETATLCDLVELRGDTLDDETVSAHLLVLWGAMPDHASARAAIDGMGASVLATLLERYMSRAMQRLPDPMTKRAVVTMLWKQRDAMSELRDAMTPTVRENIFPGARVKAFIAAAKAQLDA